MMYSRGMNATETTQHEWKGVGTQAEADALLSRHCNDGSMWLVSVVFGSMTARRWSKVRAPRRDPSAWSARMTETHFWQSGKWCPMREPTVKQVQRQEQAAYVAAGVNDGGDATAQARRWFRRQARRRAKAGR